MRILLLLITVCILSVSFGQVPFIEWQKTWGGSGFDNASSIKQTTEGGYIVAGNSESNDGDVTGNNGSSDYWIVKSDTNGNIIWQKSFGGSDDDRAWSIEKTTDGGFIVAGYSGSNDGDVSFNNGLDDFWIVKLDAIGNISWQKTLGGLASDQAYDIQQTTDGGFIVAGPAYSNDGDVIGNNGVIDYWIVKLDNNGNLIWQKPLGGSGFDIALSIQQITDGGYVVAGYSDSNDGDVTVNNGTDDFWIVKLDTSGNIIWQKTLGGSGIDRAHSIKQTIDGGFIVLGYSDSNDGDVTDNNGGFDYWFVKLDSSGNIMWQKSLGGSGDDYAWDIQQTTDGDYIVAGMSESNDGDVTGNNGSYDYWIVKLDTSGNIIWQKTLGGSGIDSANSIKQTIDGGYIVTGHSDSNDGDVIENNGSSDYWIVKLGECNETLSSFSLTSCDEYEAPDGQIYNASGIYTVTIPNSVGCDSVITIDLTITNSNSSSESITECDSYTWNTNGQTYTESGQYTEVLTNLSGCDSTVILNLTITNSNTISETITECDSYTWNTNGQTYTESGQYTELLTNNSGCDSTITLDLTINSSSSSTQTQTGTDSYTWSVNNETYTESGTYTAVIPNAVGCDSTITLDLTLEFTGLDENKSPYVAVYPNPTYNSFILSTKDMINMNYTLLDIQGKVVLTGKIESSEETVDISNLSRGQYNLVFEDENISPISIIKN